MGIHMGFDLFPPLANDEDYKTWDSFLDLVKRTCKEEHVFEEREHYYVFKAGEYPSLCKDARFFRRFSSKISGSCGAAEKHLRCVTRIAELFFGDRIHFWSDYGYQNEPKPIYSWFEVHLTDEEARKAGVNWVSK